MRIMLSLPVLAVLSACGSSSTSDLATLQGRAIAAENMAEELNGLSPTSRSRMPTTGAAQFNGYSAVIIDPIAGLNVDDILLLGDSTIQVTFAGAGTVTGQADNFAGIVGSGGVSQLVPTSGVIQIGNVDSSIGDGRPANEWQANYGGIIRVDGVDYAITGTLDGGFLGNAVSTPAPESFIKGIVGNDFDGIATTGGGSTSPVGFEIIGLNPN